MSISDKSPKSQKSKMSCIRTFLIEHDVEIRGRFWRGINRRRNENGVITIDKVPDPADLKKILHYGTSRARALFLTLASSGMRISEVIGITLNDINFNNNPSEIIIRLKVI
jgi:site-specific recombinase XerD